MKYLILIGCIALSIGCKKANTEPETKYSSVTYTVYCTSAKSVLKYVSDDTKWHTDTIRSSVYEFTVNVKDDDFGYITQLYSANKVALDSVSIHATCDRKTISAHSYKKTQAAGVTIQLSQLK